VIEPRALETRIRSWLAMPFSRGELLGHLEEESGCSMSSRTLCCDQ
jgi:hypothetical protein